MMRATRGLLLLRLSARRRLLTASTAAATGIGLTLAVPPTASADHGIATTASVTLRATPSNGSSGYGSLPKGSSPTYLCWTRGASVGGLNVWFLVNYHGHTGFIPSHYDNSHYFSARDIPAKYRIPTCSTSGHGISTTSGVAMRGTPHNADSKQGSVPKGVSPSYRCWIRGDSVHRLTVWFLTSYSGRTGFIPSYYDNSHYSSASDIPAKYHVPSCGSTGKTPTSIAAHHGSATSRPASGTYITTATRIRYCINTSIAGCSTSLYPDQSVARVATPVLAQDQPVKMICWQDGSNFTGRYRSNRWFWVESSKGVVGFVHSSYVERQTKVGNCAENSRVYAAELAVQRYGQAYANDSDQRLFAASEWAPGQVGEWSGDCVKLPYVGWYHATGGSPNLRKNSALTNYSYYKSLEEVHDGAPPVGAIVWWDIAHPYGHEALALGNGMVITTRGMDGDHKRNAIRRYDSYHNYLGWYLPH